MAKSLNSKRHAGTFLESCMAQSGETGAFLRDACKNVDRTTVFLHIPPHEQSPFPA